MDWVSWAILILAVSGLAACVMQTRSIGPALIGSIGCLVAGGLGLYGALSCLLFRQLEISRSGWNVPFGSLVIGLDSLTGVFLIPVFLIGAITAAAAIRRALDFGSLTATGGGATVTDEASRIRGIGLDLERIANHTVITDADGGFAGYKIVDPSFFNWPGLAMALRGQQISDFPLCNKSFNLSYCGHDL